MDSKIINQYRKMNLTLVDLERQAEEDNEQMQERVQHTSGAISDEEKRRIETQIRLLELSDAVRKFTPEVMREIETVRDIQTRVCLRHYCVGKSLEEAARLASGGNKVDAELLKKITGNLLKAAH